MITVQYVTPQLTLDEAYQAAYLWLDFIGEPPTKISEPADGLVELESDLMLARVRWSRTPINQSAILAMLRVASAAERRAVFSVTGYTPGAVALADTQGVALFSVDSLGQISADNAHGLSIMPTEEAPPPFTPRAEPEPKYESSPQPQYRPVEYDPDEWLDCPNCGITHHYKVNFCASCGANLHEHDDEAADPAAQAKQEVTDVHSSAQPVPSGQSSGTHLRCRVCGSTEIELIQPWQPSPTSGD